MQGYTYPQRSSLDAELEKRVSRSGFLERVDALMDWTRLGRSRKVARCLLLQGLCHRRPGQRPHPSGNGNLRLSA